MGDDFQRSLAPLMSKLAANVCTADLRSECSRSEGLKGSSSNAVRTHPKSSPSAVMLASIVDRTGVDSASGVVCGRKNPRENAESHESGVSNHVVIRPRFDRDHVCSMASSKVTLTVCGEEVSAGVAPRIVRQCAWKPAGDLVAFVAGVNVGACAPPWCIARCADLHPQGALVRGEGDGVGDALGGLVGEAVGRSQASSSRGRLGSSTTMSTKVRWRVTSAAPKPQPGSVHSNAETSTMEKTGAGASARTSPTPVSLLSTEALAVQSKRASKISSTSASGGTRTAIERGPRRTISTSTNGPSTLKSSPRRRTSRRSHRPVSLPSKTSSHHKPPTGAVEMPWGRRTSRRTPASRTSAGVSKEHVVAAAADAPKEAATKMRKVCAGRIAEDARREAQGHPCSRMICGDVFGPVEVSAATGGTACPTPWPTRP